MGLKPRPKRIQHFMHACSFCGAQTGDLIVGPRISICFECVECARDNVGEIRLARSRAKRGEGS